MKFLIVLISVFLIGWVSAVAQAPMSRSKDTLTNVDTAYLTSSKFSGYTRGAIQLNIQKFSGTVAGSAFVQVSIDGVNYVPSGLDTLTAVNGDNVKIWTIPVAYWPYYRVKVISSGTNRQIPKAFITLKQ
ncbi:hypothetical protein [Chitinophaga sp. sic0106]|uniref:hypothetical protein n=1 Tax=Chitinophaga sp. sic0106 TaxID=2854785 RepID=UPI001C45FC43|nr:hypothetical protein [Chitinophaga sp. sic0106]MBV7531341.1 hypothetical protein [Chitinophaga sp. sic0106]